MNEAVLDVAELGDALKPAGLHGLRLIHAGLRVEIVNKRVLASTGAPSLGA